MDHPEWEHVAALAGSTRPEELVDTDLSLEALAWRLFHEEREVRVDRLGGLERGCRCSANYYETVLTRFPEAAGNGAHEGFLTTLPALEGLTPG